jgi:lantibiotic modifying enzyme
MFFCTCLSWREVYPSKVSRNSITCYIFGVICQCVSPKDLEVALQTTQKYDLQGVDYLCCGNFGRLEVLLLAAQKLARPELQELALKKAAWVVARAKQTGAYQLSANLPSHAFSPSFFQGTAGIGYELLRLAYPEVLPSVLLLE